MPDATKTSLDRGDQTNSDQANKDVIARATNLPADSPPTANGTSPQAIKQPDSLADQSVKLLLFVVGSLPLPWRRAIGRALGFLIGMIPTRERKVAELQINSFLPGGTARCSPTRVFMSMGETVVESLNLQPILDQGLISATSETEGAIAWALAQHRPIVALTGHIGNWDLLGAYFANRGTPFAVVAREARSPLLQRRLQSLREQYGIDTIWRSDRAGLKRIMAVLKNQQVLGALVDQDTQVRNISVPFFGTEAATPVSLVELGLKFKAIFVATAMTRERLADGRLGFQVLVQLIEGDSPTIIIERFNRFFERLIISHPEQWVWFHKRWRTRSETQRFSSREYIDFLTRELKKRQVDTHPSHHV